MPHKQTVMPWLLALWGIIGHHSDLIKIFVILFMGELGRWLYGGGRLRERVGDLIICLLIFFLIRPHIASLPPIHGVRISPGAVAICIVLLGAHGLGQLLRWAFKKKTGIELTEEKRNG